MICAGFNVMVEISNIFICIIIIIFQEILCMPSIKCQLLSQYEYDSDTRKIYQFVSTPFHHLAALLMIGGKHTSSLHKIVQVLVSVFLCLHGSNSHMNVPQYNLASLRILSSLFALQLYFQTLPFAADRSFGGHHN